VFQVAVLTNGEKSSVTSGDETSGTTSGNARGSVNASWPFSLNKVHVLTEILAVEQQDRGSLGSVTVLVSIGGDGSDSRNAEVKVGDGIAVFCLC